MILLADYDWYLIFKKDEFDALNLASKTYTLNLEGIGQKEILVTKGNLYSMLYDDVLLSYNLNGENPFAFEGFAIYLKDGNDFYLGILKDEN